MLKKLLLIVALVLCTSSSMVALAQSGNSSISGEVVDGQNVPVIGALVLVKNSEVGVEKSTLTDVNGLYEVKSLPASSSYSIEISYFGYDPVKGEGVDLSSGQDTVYNGVLRESVLEIDNVVVLGYGAQARKQDLSASVGVVENVDALAERPVSSASSMLQGQIAGVTVTQQGGDPTKSPSVIIRGQGSQNGDQVLWVVDGVPGAPITSVNEIESMVVLKDAASAAIYGAQSGAGGVILVTTKKARVGEPSISYDLTLGLREATNLPQSLTAEDQILMRQISHENAGMTLSSGWDPTANPYVGVTRTDWVDEIFRTALYQRHNIALNVGTDKFKNRITYSINDDQGTLINTYNKSNAIRYNGSFKLNDYITITEDLSWTNSSQLSQGTESGYSGVLMSAMYMPRSAEVYNPLDGSFGGVSTEDPEYIAQYGDYSGIHGDVLNPVRQLTANNDYNNKNQLWSTTTLEIANLVKGLKFTSRYTYNTTDSYSKVFTPKRDEPGKPDNNNYLYEAYGNSMGWKLENTLTYDRTFGKHTIGALAATTADYAEGRGFSVNANNFADESDYLQYLAYAGTISEVNDYLSGPDANVSLIGRLAYSYDDRYFVTASYRRDYAGRLPKENNYGDFPAVTAAWKISNEEFFQKSEFISLLKIRASWGRIGNLGSIGWNYNSALLGMSTSGDSGQAGVTNGGTWGTTIYKDTALNPDLTWETSEQIDIGLDLSMFSDRLSASVDYFDKRTYNLIQQQTMNWPSSMGLSAPLVNQGEIRNRGVEFSATWSDSFSKDFSYFISGNFAYIRNWVSDIGVKDELGNPGVWTSDKHFRNYATVYQTAQGQPVNSFYLIQSDGIFQSDAEAAAYLNENGEMIQPYAGAGDLKFIDANGDGEINSDDRVYCGSSAPTTTYSLTLGFNYKKFSFSAMLQGVGGAQTFNIAKSVMLSDVEGNFNRSEDILDAWSPTNTDSNIPILSKTDPNGNFTTMSDWYLEDASYLRIKNITIGYDMTDLMRNIGVLKGDGTRFNFYLSGENLFTFTNYTGIDPEAADGWDALSYPMSRVISMGINLTF